LKLNLTEGLKQKVLQTGGTNVKQKKTHGPMSKLGESSGTKHTFKLEKKHVCLFTTFFL